MTSILEGELAETLTDALTGAGIPYSITVSRTTTTGPDYDPTTTTTDYVGKGWRDEYRLDQMDGTLIQTSDVRVFIIVSSLEISPTTADHVTMDGKTYSIASVDRDPAGTAWELQVRI